MMIRQWARCWPLQPPPPPQSNNRLIAGTKAESRSPENGRYTYLPFEQQRIRRGKLFVTYFTPSFLVSFKLACSRRFSKVFRRLCCRPKKESGESTLKTHQYRGLPLIHARIKYGSIEEFSMFFKTALRYHQNDLGLLFQKDREGQTACERAFKKFWKKWNHVSYWRLDTFWWSEGPDLAPCR